MLAYFRFGMPGLVWKRVAVFPTPPIHQAPLGLRGLVGKMVRVFPLGSLGQVRERVMVFPIPQILSVFVMPRIHPTPLPQARQPAVCPATPFVLLQVGEGE